MIEVCSPTQSINHPTEKVMDLSTFFGFTATVAGIIGIYLTFIQMQLPFLKRASAPKIHLGRDGYHYLEIRLSISTTLQNVRFGRLLAKGFDVGRRTKGTLGYGFGDFGDIQFSDSIPVDFQTSANSLEEGIWLWVRLHKPAESIEISIDYRWRWLHKTLRESIPVPSLESGELSGAS